VSPRTTLPPAAALPALPRTAALLALPRTAALLGLPRTAALLSLPRTAALVALPLLLAGCELGPKQSQQTGYRGAGLDQITNLSLVAKQAAIPAPLYALPPEGGERASEVYQNVKVLGDVSAERFNLLMASMSQWVAPPEQGCTYCHNPENMASDEKYTKIVARRMLQMTRTLNTRWASHVQKTGVTCWTCHRGNAVPEYRWAETEGNVTMRTIVGNKHGQNTPDQTVGYSSLPSNAFENYLRGTAQIRVAAGSAFPDPAKHHASIKDAEASYGLMMHVSQSLGVNCTYCHNTQSFRSWSLSRAQRATAYYGIRMVRDVNDRYISSLTPVFPAYRKGPHGDPYKVNCMTCHQGLSKPLGGVSMLADNPMLVGPPVPVAAPEGGPAEDAREAFRQPEEITKKQ